MRLREIPVYVTDEDIVRCDIPGTCDGVLGLPGRRVTLGAIMDDICAHVINDHGIPVEDLDPSADVSRVDPTLRPPGAPA